MNSFGFRSLFSRLFISVFLALIVFAVCMFLLMQIAHSNSDTLKNRAIARQVATQIHPFLKKARKHVLNGNRLQARYSLVVIKKSFDIFDESLNAKIGLYDAEGQLILQTDNSNLPKTLAHKPTWFSEFMPTLWNTPAYHVQVQTPSGFVIWYETRNPPPASRFAGIFNLFTGMTLLLAIMSAVLWVIAKSMTHRLDAMSKQMEKMGDGDFSVRVSTEGSDEIAMLAYGFNQSAQKIEQLINANNLLLAHASHEFRTPITRIRLQTEMLAMLGDSLADSHTTQLTKRLNAINQDLTGLNDLIESILLVSRLDAGHALEQMQSIDFYEIISQECQHYCDAKLYGEPVTITAQPKLITHLIRNLLNNAMLHGIPPVRVYVYGCKTSDETDSIPKGLLQLDCLTKTDVVNADDVNSSIIGSPIANSSISNGSDGNTNEYGTDTGVGTANNTPIITTDTTSTNLGTPTNLGSNEPCESLYEPDNKINKSLFARFKKPTAPKNPTFAVLAVIDQGTGINKDKREAIFSPFVRLKQEKKGSGLGLSLVAQIVHAHGGTIKTDTWQGNTRFLVVLPIKPKSAKAYAKDDKL